MPLDLNKTIICPKDQESINRATKRHVHEDSFGHCLILLTETTPNHPKRLPLLILPHLQEWLTRANAKYKSLEEERLWEKQLESKILVTRDGSGDGGQDSAGTAT